jgi:hypothetical protein
MRRLFLVLALLGAAALRPAAAGGGEPKPFPFAKSSTLTTGGSYYVEGRVRIPKGVSIQVQKGTMITGRGEDAVIEVEGDFQLHGVSGDRDVIRDVTIEPQAKFAQILLDTVDFDGKSLGVKTAPDVAVDGRLVVLNAQFSGLAALDVVMSANQVDIQGSGSAAPVRVKAVTPKGATANKVKLMVMNNKGGLSGGLVVEGVSDSCVRGNVIGGDKVSFSDCGVVTFDANYVTCKKVELLQSTPGRFGKTELSKCDFQIEELLAFVPYQEGKAESIDVDHCWFQGETKPMGVRDRYVKDRSRDPKNGVTVNIVKPLDAPQQLGWTVKK